MKNFIILTSSFLLLSACLMNTGSVSYSHAPNAVCPGPVSITPQVAADFQRYQDNPLMMQFYKHYVDQQRQLIAFHAHDSSVPNCPPAFWVQDSVAAEFQALPQGALLREFFKTYVAQQRALDAYYSPAQPIK